MHRPTLAIILLTFLLSSCLSPNVGLPATISPATDTPTIPLTPGTSTPDTSTPQPPSAMPTLSTPTRTPLPTIPTFTPTFDARTIVTATPAPKAECPVEKTGLEPTFPDCTGGRCGVIEEADVLNYLNVGGMLEKVDKVFSAFSNRTSMDLTGDGQKDIILHAVSGIAIDGCKDGKYQNLAFLAWEDFSGQIEKITDLNGNGIPEIIFARLSRYGYITLYVYEWDGREFRSLIDVDIRYRNEHDKADGVSTLSQYKLVDTNGDGLKEVVITRDSYRAFIGGFHTDAIPNLPLRDQIVTLGWNGRNYVDLTQEQYAAPQYRFQAVQDGDWATLYGRYESAFSFYQTAIFSDQLDWWSPERSEYEIDTAFSRENDSLTPTVYPTLVPDSTEYSQLAAYAYYRMVILHTYLGEMDAAQIKYATLQEKSPAGNPGHPYVEMATDFWNAYQSSGQMYNACAAAIAYADAHPEILIPLGSDYHGAQSRTYVPADVCPFR